MASGQPLGVGIIGTGFGRKIHIPGLQIHPDTVPVALLHRDRARASEIAREYGIPHACDRIDDLLALPEVEAVTVATPPFLHYEQAKAAILAGKHVLLEKPVTMRVEEAIELYRLARDRGVVVGVDFEFRTCPPWRTLKDWLERQEIGALRLIAIDWLVQGRADGSRPWDWYSRVECGGGALGALGAHACDYIAWLFGRVRQLSAHLHASIPVRFDALGLPQPVTADDTCNVLLELADGTPCNLRISTSAWHGRGHWVTVYGDRGTLRLGSANLKDYVHGFGLQLALPDRAEWERVPVPSHYEFPQIYPDGRLAPFVAICDRFARAIAAGTPMTPGLREGIYSQLLLDRVRVAHHMRQWVEVPSLEEVLGS